MVKVPAKPSSGARRHTGRGSGALIAGELPWQAGRELLGSIKGGIDRIASRQDVTRVFRLPRKASRTEVIDPMGGRKRTPA